MALTEDLNIYRSMYKLLLAIIDARNDFDKSFKYVVGERMVNTALLSLLHGRFTRYTAYTPEASPADVVSLCCRPIASRSIVPARAPSSHSGLFLRHGAAHVMALPG